MSVMYQKFPDAFSISRAYTVKATTPGPKKKWSLNRGGLLIEVKLKCMVKPQLGHDQVVFE